jgi:hypothetical protein
MKGKSRKTFDIIISTKPAFIKFHFAGFGGSFSPAAPSLRAPLISTNTSGCLIPQQLFGKPAKDLMTPKLTHNTSLQKKKDLFSELPVAYSQKHGQPSL